MNEQDVAMREQLSFEKQQREWREQRIIQRAIKEPSLTISVLAERFGMSDSGMYDLLVRHGLARPVTDRMDYRRCNVKYSYYKSRAG